MIGLAGLVALIGLIGLVEASALADPPPTELVLPADGAFAIVGHGDAVWIWRRTGGRIEVPPVELPPLPPSPFGYPESTLRWVGVSADGRTAATAHEAGFVSMFDPRDGRRGPLVAIDLRGPITGPWTRLEVAPAPGGAPMGCGNAPRDLTRPALSPDGTRLLTVGWADLNPRVALWDTRSGELLRTWTSDEHVSTAAFSVNGEPVIQAGGELVVLGAVPRFVAHGLERSEYDPATGTLLVHVPGAHPARVDPVSGAVTLSTGDEDPSEGSPLSTTSADGSVRVTVGADGVPRFEPVSRP